MQTMLLDGSSPTSHLEEPLTKGAGCAKAPRNATTNGRARAETATTAPRQHRRAQRSFRRRFQNPAIHRAVANETQKRKWARVRALVNGKRNANQRGLLSLPNELLYTIFDVLVADSYYLHRRTLPALCLTSKKIGAVASLFLYRTIRGGGLRLLETMIANKRKGGLVRTLIIHEMRLPTIDMLTPPNLPAWLEDNPLPACVKGQYHRYSWERLHPAVRPFLLRAMYAIDAPRDVRRDWAHDLVELDSQKQARERAVALLASHCTNVHTIAWRVEDEDQHPGTFTLLNVLSLHLHGAFSQLHTLQIGGCPNIPLGPFVGVFQLPGLRNLSATGLRHLEPPWWYRVDEPPSHEATLHRLKTEGTPVTIEHSHHINTIVAYTKHCFPLGSSNIQRLHLYECNIGMEICSILVSSCRRLAEFVFQESNVPKALRAWRQREFNQVLVDGLRTELAVHAGSLHSLHISMRSSSDRGESLDLANFPRLYRCTTNLQAFDTTATSSLEEWEYPRLL